MVKRYLITTVNWNPPQTKVWLWHLKNVYRGNDTVSLDVRLLEDTKPVPWSWSAGKLNCYNLSLLPSLAEYDGHVYMDTDTIITRDFLHTFETMGREGTVMAVSFNMAPIRMVQAISKQLAKEFPEYKSLYKHASSGLLCLDTEGNGRWVRDVYDNWLNWYRNERFLHAFKKHKLADEIALSMAIVDMKIPVCEVPRETHGNVLGGRVFGKAEYSDIIHYHNNRRLRKYDLGRFIDMVK